MLIYKIGHGLKIIDYMMEHMMAPNLIDYYIIDSAIKLKTIIKI